MQQGCGQRADFSEPQYADFTECHGLSRFHLDEVGVVGRRTTRRGEVFGDGVGGAVRKEDTAILEMWNAAIAEMSKDGTTAEITKRWFGRDISM